jgi:hypothetical protein
MREKDVQKTPRSLMNGLMCRVPDQSMAGTAKCDFVPPLEKLTANCDISTALIESRY